MNEVLPHAHSSTGVHVVCSTGVCLLHALTDYCACSYFALSPAKRDLKRARCNSAATLVKMSLALVKDRL
jgi:hypothetical protein